MCEIINSDTEQKILQNLDKFINAHKNIEKIFIKPNMTMVHPRHGITTSEWLVKLVANYFLEKNLTTFIVESSTGSHNLSISYRHYNYYGLKESKVGFIDLAYERFFISHVEGLPEIKLPLFIKEKKSLFVNLPCIKQSSPYLISGAMKNLLGLLVNLEKHKFHNVMDECLTHIYKSIECSKIGIADGTYFWFGDILSGCAVQKNIFIFGNDFLKLDKTIKQLLYPDGFNGR